MQYLFPLLALGLRAHAHTVAWAKGMYCFGGADPSTDDPSNNLAVAPLYDLSQEEWWFQHDRGCDQAPPADGDILDLPAGGSFTVEMAHNRAQTTFSFDGAYTSDWPDGKDHPEDWKGPGNPPDCIQDDGAMHTNNETMAAGTAFAISYNSDMADVTLENLVVFTVLEHTPWKRLATYDVPADLPPCPERGCTCAWLWVPNGCGEPNMYMAGYKCTVTGSNSSKEVSTAQAPVYCADDESKCVSGAKQMIVFQQAEGNNVEVPPGATPSYSEVCGFKNGAQDDIFV